MKQLFTSEQIAYMEELGLTLNYDNLNRDDLEKIVDTVGDRLMYCGFSKDYEPNTEGTMCESIITIVTTRPDW